MHAAASASRLKHTFCLLHASIAESVSAYVRQAHRSSSHGTRACYSSSSCSSNSSSRARTSRVNGVKRKSYATQASSTTNGSTAGDVLEPALYVVGTPIGNLEDMSFRAIRVLQGAHLILAEDTRHTRKLLEYYAIRTPTLSCHEHNERQRQELVLQRLQQGEPIALVSDAGMPAISDPGAVIVAAAVAAGVRVVPVPGPCAAIAALAAAGLPTDSFYFAGFLPPKTAKRREALQQNLNVCIGGCEEQLQQLPSTLVFYAPPHGLSAILSDLAEVLGPLRQTVVARELTKLHEEFVRGSLQQVLDEFGPDSRRAVKGEVVLLVAGCSPQEQQYAALSAAVQTAQADGLQQPSSKEELVRQLISKELAKGNSVSGTAKELSRQLQLPRSKVYKMALELQQQQQ